MDEKLLEILEQFDLTVESTYRGRGATICNTDQGIKIVKEFHGSAGKLMDEYELMKSLKEHGFPLVDQYVKNKKDGFFVTDRYQTTFIMKDHFEGRECDIRSMMDLKMAAENLAQFHKTVGKVTISGRTLGQYEPVEAIWKKRNEELKRTRSYISKVNKKGRFERLYMETYPCFYEQARYAYDELKQLPDKIKQLRLGICHGEYNQHNIIKVNGRVATINLSHFQYQNQLMDLHQFLRKALEKNNYHMETAISILSNYHKVIPLTRDDYQYLYVLLLYPEKFYKISNHYYNGKKCWISPKNIEKLLDEKERNATKEEFLKNYQQQYLFFNTNTL